MKNFKSFKLNNRNKSFLQAYSIYNANLSPNQESLYNSNNNNVILYNLFKKIDMLPDKKEIKSNKSLHHINNTFQFNSKNNSFHSKFNLNYTPIPKKTKKMINFNLSPIDPNSKIKSKINDLKKEIGIFPETSNLDISYKKEHISFSSKKEKFNKILYYNKANNNLDNKIKKGNNYISFSYYDNKDKGNGYKNKLLKDKVDFDVNVNNNVKKNFTYKIIEINKIMNTNLLSKNQIKNRYYQSRNNLNNLNVNMLKNSCDFNSKNKRQKELTNKTFNFNLKKKTKKIYEFNDNRKINIFENININDFIKTNKNKKIYNLITKNLNQLSKELQEKETIDIKNIDNSSIYEENKNKNINND